MWLEWRWYFFLYSLQIPDSCIMDYYEKYKHRMNELEAFNMVKVIGLIVLPCMYVLV